MGIPDHLTCLLRNLYAGQEATVRTGHGTTDWFQIGKRVCQVCILSPSLFNFYAEYIMWNARLDEAQTGIKIARRNTNNLIYTDDITLMTEREEELKSLLMKVKEESEKSDLKLNTQKMKIMRSSSITSWQIDGETMETVTDFILGGSKITCRWWLQPWNYRTLAPWKRSNDQPRQHIKKQKHYFADKGLSSQSYGFSSSHVWMRKLDYKESWSLKNWCFWTVVLEETLESPLDSKEIQPVHPKGDHSWIFIGRTDAEAETPILWPLMWRSDTLEKTLMLGKVESRNRRGWQRMRWLDDITDSVDMSLISSRS